MQYLRPLGYCAPSFEEVRPSLLNSIGSVLSAPKDFSEILKKWVFGLSFCNKIRKLLNAQWLKDQNFTGSEVIWTSLDTKFVGFVIRVLDSVVAESCRVCLNLLSFAFSGVSCPMP